MRGLGRRLERLEALQKAERTYETSPHVLLYLKHTNNARREVDGLEPVPLTPEEEELERESEMDALESPIPRMRDDPGCQGEEARASLDLGKRDARERVRKKCYAHEVVASRPADIVLRFGSGRLGRSFVCGPARINLPLDDGHQEPMHHRAPFDVVLLQRPLGLV